MTMAASDRFEVPAEMRALAEKSVEQARQAFDGFISAAHQAVSAFEGHAETAAKAPGMSLKRQCLLPSTTSRAPLSLRKIWCERKTCRRSCGSRGTISAGRCRHS